MTRVYSGFSTDGAELFPAGKGFQRTILTEAISPPSYSSSAEQQRAFRPQGRADHPARCSPGRRPGSRGAERAEEAAGGAADAPNGGPGAAPPPARPGKPQRHVDGRVPPGARASRPPRGPAPGAPPAAVRPLAREPGGTSLLPAGCPSPPQTDCAAASGGRRPRTWRGPANQGAGPGPPRGAPGRLAVRAAG